MIIKTFRVMLCPNDKQNTKLFECAGAARYVFNWTLWYQKVNYEFGYSFQNDIDLRRVLTQLKHDNPKFQWLENYSNNIAKQAVKDACGAFYKFFKGKAKYPRFKSKRKTKPSFYVDPCNIKFTGTHVILEKLSNSRKKNRKAFNAVRLAEANRIPVDAKYYNPRVTYDGLHWWLSVGIECESESNEDISYSEGIGIDLGIKALVICSDNRSYTNINKTDKVRKLNKKTRRLQRKVAKKYLKNKKGACYCKTRNIIKSERQLLKVNRKLTNIRNTYLHTITPEIVKRKPSFIVLEDLNVKGMLRNKHLAKSIQEQGFSEFHRQIAYKCEWNGIKLIIADRFFPSSKLCCRCGNIKKDLKLSDRVYHCLECGNTIDRDYQASVNLRNYGIRAHT